MHIRSCRFSLFHAGSEIVGSAELRKRKHETFRVPFSFASSPLSESLEQASADLIQAEASWKLSSTSE